MMGRHRTRPVEIATARSFDALRSWPQEALDAMHVAFERKRQGAGPTWAELLTELQQAFGVTWNDSSLSRYYGYWRSTLYVEDRAYQQAEAFIERLKSGPTPDLLTAVKQAILQQQLVAATELHTTADPVSVVKLGQRERQLDQRGEQIKIEKQKADQAERKLAAIETKLQQADKQVEALAERRNLDAETLAEIKGIYGLGHPTEN